MNSSTQTFTQILLTVFLGFLVAAFIGFGVAAFYQAPKAPEFPSSLPSIKYPGATQTAAELQAETSYNEASQKYQADLQNYNKYVASITLLAAVLLMAVSIWWLKGIPVITDGLLLGGVFTVIYSISRAIASTNTRVEFATVAIGLLVAVTVIILKFVKPLQKAS